MIDTVYQTNKFEVVSLSDPELGEALEGWGVPEALDSIPEDAITQMRETNAYVILNKSSGGVGVIDSITLATTFEEYHPSETNLAIKKTFVEKVLARATELQELDESEDFYRGANAFLDLMTEVRASGPEGFNNESV